MAAEYRCVVRDLVLALLLVPVATQGMTYVVRVDGTGDFPRCRQVSTQLLTGTPSSRSVAHSLETGNRDIDFSMEG